MCDCYIRPSNAYECVKERVASRFTVIGMHIVFIQIIKYGNPVLSHSKNGGCNDWCPIR